MYLNLYYYRFKNIINVKNSFNLLKFKSLKFKKNEILYPNKK